MSLSGFALGPVILSRRGILLAGVGQDRLPPPARRQVPGAKQSRALSGAWGSRGRDVRDQEPE